MSPRYIITYQDENGECFQLEGAWEAASPSDAISLMLKEARSEDSSGYEAHLVTGEADIIE